LSAYGGKCPSDSRERIDGGKEKRRSTKTEACLQSSRTWWYEPIRRIDYVPSIGSADPVLTRGTRSFVKTSLAVGCRDADNGHLPLGFKHANPLGGKVHPARWLRRVIPAT
jgi:hypothetical protein